MEKCSNLMFDKLFILVNLFLIKNKDSFRICYFIIIANNPSNFINVMYLFFLDFILSRFACIFHRIGSKFQSSFSRSVILDPSLRQLYLLFQYTFLEFSYDLDGPAQTSSRHVNQIQLNIHCIRAFLMESGYNNQRTNQIAKHTQYFSNWLSLMVFLWFRTLCIRKIWKIFLVVYIFHFIQSNLLHLWL